MSSKNQIIKSLAKITGLPETGVHLEVPENEEFGDYATNVALQLKNLKTKKSFDFAQDEPKNNLTIQPSNYSAISPRQVAEAMAEKLRQDKELSEIIDKIEAAGPGFINFWLSKRFQLTELENVVKKADKFGKLELLEGKKYLIEHTSPNTIKTLHVGHVRNNVLGMAVHNILEMCGAVVMLDAINNDRGIHVMKAVWAYIKHGKGSEPSEEKPDYFVDKFYVMGAKAYEDDDVAREEMHELLRKWEKKDEKVRSVWKKLRDWTYEGFKVTYKRLGSHHDKQWFESNFYEHGKEMVEEGLKKGVFKKLEDGAVLSNLEKYGLSDTVVLRADGTSMYHTQDLYLSKLKREKFPSDLYIWDIGPEQELYLKQLFAMCEQLSIGRREDYYHMSYGFVYLKGKGKMSSRAGTIISADWLIDEVVKKAKEIIDKSETSRGLSDSEKNDVAEVVGLGAIKYGLLKLARLTDLQFDIDESLSLEGNSGPYLQYTYARCQSVLNRAKLSTNNFQLSNKLEINNEEAKLLRSFIHFPEVIEDAAKNYSPNLLCNYLFDLAQKFNLFYQKHRILEGKKLEDRSEKLEKKPITNHQPARRSISAGGSPITRDFRIALTSATGQILKNGLGLLGIQTTDRM